MTGYVPCGLILGLGGYWALLLHCADDNVVRVPTSFARYLKAIAAIARAAAEVERRLVDAFAMLSHSQGVFQMDLARGIFIFRECSNCGQLPFQHTPEAGFGLVCPTDVAARTDAERFTYTRREEWPA